MILGGSRFAIPVVRAAQALGCRAVTCDYLPDNAAHRVSDAYCNVSVVDREAVLAAARAQRIDGILSFACDPGVETAAYVAEAMGLPSCGPYGSVRILQDKGRFRRFLREHGFNAPMSKTYTSVNAWQPDADAFRWPVFVKPVDSAGSKGAGLAGTPEALPARAAEALRYSRSGAYIVEDYIAAEGAPSDCDCFSVDGKLRYVAFNSQHFDPEAPNPCVPAAYHWPAEMPRIARENLRSEIQRLLSLLGMGTGLYNIETRLGRDGKAYIMECAPRGGGNRLAECMETATGVPLVENAVRAALGLPILDMPSGRDMAGWAIIVLHSRRAGIFRGVRIHPRLEAFIREKDLWVSPGTRIEAFHAANAAIGTLLLHFTDPSTLYEVMRDPQAYAQVCVEQG